MSIGNDWAREKKNCLSQSNSGHVWEEIKQTVGKGVTDIQIKLSRLNVGDFPGGTVVKNPPANAGDTGSSPGPGRSHMPWSN